MSLANQVVNYSGQPTEAIVVAADDTNAHLYLVDSDCKVTCHDDVGFVAIGIGAWHAKSLLMQARYFSGNNFAAALALAHTAKKKAEIAPGVGKSTDMFMVTKTGWAPVAAELQAAVEQTYEEYDKRYSELLAEQYTRLAEAFKEVAEKAKQQLPAAEPPQLPMSDQRPDDKSAAAN